MTTTQNSNQLERMEELASKAVYVSLRMLHARTGSNAMLAIQNAAYYNDEDATIYNDLLQAARLTLHEYCTNYQYNAYSTIYHKRTGRAVSPFSLACAAVHKTINQYANKGYTGDTNAVHAAATNTATINHETPETYGIYEDDTTEIYIKELKCYLTKRQAEVIDLMADGYDMKNIAIKLDIALAYVYEIRAEIRKKLLSTGDYDIYA